MAVNGPAAQVERRIMNAVNAEIIKIAGLNKSYGKLAVLKDLSLSVNKGEKISIIGPSGCGKSTLLRMINLLEKPDRGQILIEGREITAAKADIDKMRSKIGMVFQNFNLFNHLNVLENIILAPTHVKKVPRNQAVARAKELLDMVSLRSKLLAFPSELSGGQKQRIAIARCLAMDPAIMLFDEPTSALDPLMVSEVLSTIRALAKQGMTMLIVTHEMGLAREISDRVLYMDEMGIYEAGSPAAIFENPVREKTIAFIFKHKNFSEHIGSRIFDMINFNARTELFCHKYNISSKRLYNIQLTAEELISGLIERCYQKEEAPDIDINIVYSEASGDMQMEIGAKGKYYNPFEAAAEKETGTGIDEANLGFLIVRGMAKDLHYEYRDGKNKIDIIL
jgi:polar amino acid transport system ATP-binding protein